MTRLSNDQLLNYEGGTASCTLLERSTFMSFRYSYWACSDGSYYATISKYSAEKRMYEVVTDLEFPENW